MKNGEFRGTADADSYQQSAISNEQRENYSGRGRNPGNEKRR